MNTTAGAKPENSRVTMAAMMRMMFTMNRWGRASFFSSSVSSAILNSALVSFTLPRRAFSRAPSRAEMTMSTARPTSTAGSTGRKKATGFSPKPRAVAARRVGPPQGRMFMVPADMATMVARVVRFMPTASYRGTRGGTQIRKVTAPEPSRWTIMARMEVPMAMRMGLVPTSLVIPPMMGRKVPASVRMPKNRMEKMNMTPVAATDSRPSSPAIMPPRLLTLARKSTTPGAPSGSVTMKAQAMMPVTTGTAMSATAGAAFLVMISTSMAMTVTNPSRDNM